MVKWHIVQPQIVWSALKTNGLVVQQQHATNHFSSPLHNCNK